MEDWPAKKDAAESKSREAEKHPIADRLTNLANAYMVFLTRPLRARSRRERDEMMIIPPQSDDKRRLSRPKVPVDPTIASRKAEGVEGRIEYGTEEEGEDDDDCMRPRMTARDEGRLLVNVKTTEDRPDLMIQ